MNKNTAPDSIIFDVDGVLLDVRKSFPEVIRLCILEGWKLFCGGTVDDVGYTKEHEQILKRHHAFNDDYDIAWTLLTMSAKTNNPFLSKSFPSPQKLKEELKSFSGTLQDWVLSRYGNLVPRLEVRKYCNDLYAGTSEKMGLYNLETPMVNCHWSELPLPVGIYTGRNLAEFELAKKSLNWEDFPMDLVIHYDSGIEKPSAEGLRILSEKMRSTNPYFLGDTASDMISHSSYGIGKFLAIGDLLPEAELIFQRTEEALSYIFKQLNS